MITDEMVEAALREFKCWVGDGYSPSKQQIRAALEAAERAAWRPISEAPKDGTVITATNGGWVGEVWYSHSVWLGELSKDGAWVDCDPRDGHPLTGSCAPTHFRPRPPLPTAPEAA